MDFRHFFFFSFNNNNIIPPQIRMSFSYESFMKVAFPGGLRPDVCPSDDMLSVSINECRADIGLDLGDEAVFRAIGRLDDR